MNIRTIKTATLVNDNGRYGCTVRCLFSLVIMVMLIAGRVDAANLVSYYDFNNNFTDAQSGSTLTQDGVFQSNSFCTQSGGGGDSSCWQWTTTTSPGAGFVVDVTPDISCGYSIGVRFSYNTAGTGYKKIIDYQNHGSDNGFYLLGNKLMFYPSGKTGTTTVADNEIIDVVATRNCSTGEFVAYIVDNSGNLVKPELLIRGQGTPRFSLKYEL